MPQPREYIPRYLEARKPHIAPGTHHRYKHILERWDREAPEDVNEWLLTLDKTNIVKCEWQMKIGFYFNWCVDQKLIVATPLMKYSTFKRKFPVPPPDRKPITVTEYHQLLSKATGYWEYAIRTAWATGMRLVDICLLEKDSVDFQRASIRVIPQKTMKWGKIVEIPCDDLLMFYRKMFNFDPRCKYVCGAMAGDYHWERLNCPFGNMISVKFRMFAHSHGVMNTFHGFRHAFVTRLLTARVPAETIATMTGHSIATIATYYHPTLDDKRKALSCIL